MAARAHPAARGELPTATAVRRTAAAPSAAAPPGRRERRPAKRSARANAATRAPRAAPRPTRCGDRGPAPGTRRADDAPLADAPKPGIAARINCRYRRRNPTPGSGAV